MIRYRIAEQFSSVTGTHLWSQCHKSMEGSNHNLFLSKCPSQNQNMPCSEILVRRLKPPSTGLSCSISTSDADLVLHFPIPSGFSPSLGCLCSCLPFICHVFANSFSCYLCIFNHHSLYCLPIRTKTKHTFYLTKHDLCNTLIILTCFPNHIR